MKEQLKAITLFGFKNLHFKNILVFIKQNKLYRTTEIFGKRLVKYLGLMIGIIFHCHQRVPGTTKHYPMN